VYHEKIEEEKEIKPIKEPKKKRKPSPEIEVPLPPPPPREKAKWQFDDTDNKQGWRDVSDLVNSVYEYCYLSLLSSGELPGTKNPPDFYKFNPMMGEYTYSITVQRKMNSSGDVVGFQTNLQTNKKRNLKRFVQ